LRKNINLAFLKKINQDKYEPLTDLSVIEISNGILSPIWKQKPDKVKSKFDIIEFKLEEISKELKNELKKRASCN